MPSVKFEVPGDLLMLLTVMVMMMMMMMMMELHFVSGSVSVRAVEVVPLIHHGVPLF